MNINNESLHVLPQDVNINKNIKIIGLDKKIIEIATSKNCFPNLMKTLDRLGINFGFCELKIEGKSVLVKISDLSKALKISKSVIHDFHSRGELEKLIQMHNRDIEYENSLEPSHSYLEPTEIQNLKNFSKLIKDFRDPLEIVEWTKEDKKKVETFILHNLGNKNFSDRLELSLTTKLPYNVSQETMQFFIHICSKSRHHRQFQRITSKAENLVQKLSPTPTLKDIEKISLSELGILEEFSELSTQFELLDKLNLLNKPYLKKLHNKSLQASRVLDHINTYIQEQIGRSNSYQSGDVILRSSTKWKEFLNRRVLSKTQLTPKADHVSVIYRDQTKNKNTMHSHVVETHRKDFMKAQDFVSSEIWHIECGKLMDPQSKGYQLLIKIYEFEKKDINVEIQKIFEEASRSFHQEAEKNLEEMENDKTNTSKKGGKFELQHKPVRQKNGVVQVYSTVTTKSHKKMSSAEFFAKATIATLIEADKRLVQKIESFDKTNLNHPMIASLGKEQLKEKKNQGLKLLNLGLDPKEKLKDAKPARLLAILRGKKALNQIEPPKVLHQIFSHETFYPQHKTQLFLQKRSKALHLIGQAKIKEAIEICDQLAKSKAPSCYYQDILDQYSMKPNEWSTICKQHPISPKDPRKNFTDLEMKALKILIKNANSTQKELNPLEKRLLVQFFTHIYQNSDFNQRVSTLLESFKITANEKMVCSHLREFSFKSHNFAKLPLLRVKIEKISSLLKSHQEEQIQSDSDRLTLQEIHEIESVSHSIELFEWIEKLNISDSFLGNIKTDVKKISESFLILVNRYVTELDIESGDITLHPMSISSKTDHITRLRKKILRHKFQHAGVGVARNRRKQSADILNQLKISPTHLVNFSLHIQRLSFKKLITSSGWEFLKAEFPQASAEEIENKIKSKFNQLIQNLLKDEKTFSNLNYSLWRAILSVLKLNKSFSSKEFSQLDFSARSAIICSEFAGVVIGLCLDILNNELQEEAKNSLHAKRKKSTVPGTTMLTNPLKHQNLEALHPDRLYHVFKDYTSKVELPQFLKNIIVQTEEDIS